jgi:hypothetical protein
MRKKSLTKDERKIQIINWFSIRIQHDNDDYATSYEIARGMGLSPSTHLRKIIGELEDDGSLESTTLEKSGRWLSRGYRLKRGTFQRPPKQENSKIKFTFGPAHNRQMELF